MSRAERARRSAAARAAAIASTRPTTPPGSESTSLRVGDTVRATRATGSTGTWSTYDGRIGWVAVVVRQTFPDGRRYVEVGVTWTAPSKAHPAADAYFRVDELEVVS